jgi:hypothetical protein
VQHPYKRGNPVTDQPITVDDDSVRVITHVNGDTTIVDASVTDEQADKLAQLTGDEFAAAIADIKRQHDYEASQRQTADAQAQVIADPPAPDLTAGPDPVTQGGTSTAPVAFQPPTAPEADNVTASRLGDEPALTAEAVKVEETADHDPAGAQLAPRRLLLMGGSKANADDSTSGIESSPVPAGTGEATGLGASSSQAWIVSALAVIGTILLAALGKDIPDVLLVLDGSSITGAAALSFPTRKH